MYIRKHSPCFPCAKPLFFTCGFQPTHNHGIRARNYRPIGRSTSPRAGPRDGARAAQTRQLSGGAALAPMSASPLSVVDLAKLPSYRLGELGRGRYLLDPLYIFVPHYRVLQVCVGRTWKHDLTTLFSDKMFNFCQTVGTPPDRDKQQKSLAPL